MHNGVEIGFTLLCISFIFSNLCEVHVSTKKNTTPETSKKVSTAARAAAPAEAPSEPSTMSEVNLHRDVPRIPRVQNRRVVVLMYPEVLPDGETKRIVQVLDAPLPFSVHREFVEALNQVRTLIYGDDGGLYETKNVEIPQNDHLVVHAVFINSKSGKISGRKVFTSAEADSYLKKIRSEMAERRERNRQDQQSNSGSSEFGESLGDALASAKTSHTAAEASAS